MGRKEWVDVKGSPRILSPHRSSPFPMSHVQAPYPSPVLLKIPSWASGSVTLAYRLGNFCPHWPVSMVRDVVWVRSLNLWSGDPHDLVLANDLFIEVLCEASEKVLQKGMHLIILCPCLLLPAGNIDTISRAGAAVLGPWDLSRLIPDIFESWTDAYYPLPLSF